MKTNESWTSDEFQASLENCGCTQSAAEPGLDHVSWRDLFGGFGSAATRIHRYRDLRTRMLHRALCENDSHFETDRSCNDE